MHALFFAVWIVLAAATAVLFGRTIRLRNERG